MGSMQPPCPWVIGCIDLKMHRLADAGIGDHQGNWEAAAAAASVAAIAMAYAQESYAMRVPSESCSSDLDSQYMTHHTMPTM